MSFLRSLTPLSQEGWIRNVLMIYEFEYHIQSACLKFPPNRLRRIKMSGTPTTPTSPFIFPENKGQKANSEALTLVSQWLGEDNAEIQPVM